MSAFRDIFTAPTPNAFTENGAPTFSSSQSYCVDFFGNVCRSGKTLTPDVQDKILRLLPDMWNENPLVCLKLIFYKRDCRGGAGERKIFEVCYDWLINNHLYTAVRNIKHIPYFGFYKDWVKLYKLDHNPTANKEIKNLFVQQLQQDKIGMDKMESISLAAKWAPSIGTKDPNSKALAKVISSDLFNSDGKPKFGWEKPYRKFLSTIREYLNITERLMCSQHWDNIDFSKVPSLCMQKNKKHFQKHCPEKFDEWVARIKAGKAKVNAAQLMPHQLVEEIEKTRYAINQTQEDLIQEQWNVIVENTRKALGNRGILVVTDLSGSMSGLPMTVSIAMGCLLSEVSTGPFKDLVITFSETPSFFQLQGQGLRKRIESLESSNSIGFNTDLNKVFSILLKRCVENKVKQEDLPEMIIICTDNEFDSQIKGDVSATTYQNIKSKFAEKGYKIPIVVFWNLRGNANSIPVTKDELGTVLLSGFSPAILKCLLTGEIPTPYTAMLKAISDERYDRLEVVD